MDFVADPELADAILDIPFRYHLAPRNDSHAWAWT